MTMIKHDQFSQQAGQFLIFEIVGETYAFEILNV